MTQPSPLPSSPQYLRDLQEQWRLLWPLAVPVVISQFAANALSLIATAVLGRLGSAELAAAGYAQALYYLVFLLLTGTMLAVPARMAVAYGARDVLALRHNLYAGLLLATLLTLIFLPLIYGLAYLLPRFAPADLQIEWIRQFLQVYALGMWPLLLSIPLRGVLEATGKAQKVTFVALACVAFAMLASPTLTFGWGIFPALGVAGAAAGSALAAWIALFLLWPLAQKRLNECLSEHVNEHLDEHAEIQPTQSTQPIPSSIWPILRALVALGIPIGLTLGIEGGLFSMTSLLMSRFGPEVLAAHDITLKIITALFMIPLGIASATSLRVGQELGHGNKAAARQAGFVGMGASVTVMLSFAVLELLAPKVLIGIFLDLGNPANAVVWQTAISLLVIAAFFQAVDGLQVTAGAALRGLQDTRVPFFISLFSYWGIGLGSGVLLAFRLDFGARGLWYGLSLGLLVASMLLLWRFLRLTKRN